MDPLIKAKLDNAAQIRDQRYQADPPPLPPGNIERGVGGRGGARHRKVSDGKKITINYSCALSSMFIITVVSGYRSRDLDVLFTNLCGVN
jgi:hypothetical protein